MVTPTIHLRNYCTKLVYVKKYVIVFNGFNANSGLSSNQYYFYSCHYFYSCTTKKNLQTTPLSLSLSLSRLYNSAPDLCAPTVRLPSLSFSLSFPLHLFIHFLIIHDGESGHLHRVVWRLFRIAQINYSVKWVYKMDVCGVLVNIKFTVI